MTSRPDCIGVVLAGGASRRMGSDKANLLWRGIPMHAHLCELLERAGATRVLVSGRRELKGGVADAQAHRGPLCGLAAVFSMLPICPSWLLVLAIDMPRLRPETLWALAPGPGYDYRSYRDYRLPLGVQLSAKTHHSIRSCAAATEPAKRSLGHWLAQLKGQQLDTNDAIAWELQSANTPQEWQALQ